MLNLIAQPATDLRPPAYAEAVSRLASVRHALRLVDGGFSVGPGGDMAHDDAIAVAWDECGEAKQRRFDRSSERLVSATAAGVEALLIERRGFLRDGRAVEFTQSFYRGDAYDFVARLGDL